MEQYFDYNSKLKVKDKLFTPDYGVKLTGGLFKRVFDNNIQFNITQLDSDRMRYWFDVKRKIPTKAKPYTGHFEDDLKGQTAFQYLMCAGNALRWEENEQLRRGMNEIIDYMDDSQEDDGFIIPINKFDFAYKEYPGYVRIWLTYGLIAAAKAKNKKASKMLRLWQDWFNRCPDLPVIKYLELAFQGVVASGCVYMTPIGISEDIEITRKYYEEDWRLSQFLNMEQSAVSERHQHGHEPHPHGSELEAMEGYLDLYRYTGAPYYLNAVLNCMILYKLDWQHAGGGIVMCERLKGGQNYKRAIYPSEKYTYNELCSSAFWLQLNQRLHRIYPEREDYVFEMEQTLYNIAIASQNGTIDIRNFSWMDMIKAKPQRPNHCCSGVGTRIFASLPEYLYTLNKSVLSCDIYCENQLLWDTGKQTIKVMQTTEYPYNGEVRLKFEMGSRQEFALRIRIPKYAREKVDIFVNGKKQVVGNPGEYAEIFRCWESGDVVRFEILFSLNEHLYYGDDDVDGYTRCAYTYGPLLLAILGERNHENGIVMKGTPQEFKSRLIPDETPLHFSVENCNGYRLIPYFEVQNEQFVCYPMFKGKHKPDYVFDPWLKGVQGRPWLRD